MTRRSSAKHTSNNDDWWKDEAYYKQLEEDKKYMQMLQRSLHRKIHGGGPGAGGAPAVSAQKVAWFSSKPPYQPLNQPPLYQWCSTANGVRVHQHDPHAVLGPAAKQEYMNYANNTGFGNRARCAPDNPSKCGEGVWEKCGTQAHR